MPRSREIIRATIKGIHIVFQVSFADLAEVMTGAIIKATTQGLIPMKIEDITRLFLIISGVRKIAMKRIIRKEGSMVPSEAIMLPFPPRILSPIAVAMFTAKMPGRDWAMAKRSRKSLRSIQWCLSTISRSIIDIIAHPPPKVKAPILKKVEKRLQYELSGREPVSIAVCDICFRI